MIYVHSLFPRLYWDFSVRHFLTIVKHPFYFIATVVTDVISWVVKGLEKFVCNRSINRHGKDQPAVTYLSRLIKQIEILGNYKTNETQKMTKVICLNGVSSCYCQTQMFGHTDYWDDPVRHFRV